MDRIRILKVAGSDLCILKMWIPVVWSTCETTDPVNCWLADTADEVQFFTSEALVCQILNNKIV